MKLFRTLIFAGIIPLASGANKEMIELQRDMMTLQDQVRQINDKLTVLTTLLQGSLETNRQTNISMGTMQERLEGSIKQQREGVAGPVTAVGQKLDQMSEDFRGVRENVLDINSRMGKLDAKITDLQSVIQTVKAMPPPPQAMNPGQDTANSGPVSSMPLSTPPVSSAPVRTATPPAGMLAETTYTNAYRDYIAGTYDLAMQEFSDYLRYFPTTQFAPNAQYYIGDIYYRRKDYDNAIQAFDAVLEHFSDNTKTGDAHLMKGRSLQAQGKRDAASREYKEIISRYPDSDAAAKAKTLLRELGLSPSSSSKPKARKRR